MSYRAPRKRVLLALSYYDHRHHAGVARYAAEHGWALEDAYTQMKSLPHDWDGEGVISFHGDDPDYIAWLTRAAARTDGPHVVDIGEPGGLTPFPRVCSDAPRLAELAVGHFAAKGYTTLGFTWLVDRPVVRSRAAALAAEAARQNINLFELPLDQVRSLATAALPVGLIAANDAVAVRALRACEDAGLHVPEQVAILGIDNFEYRCVPAAVPLSSVDAAQERIGYEAAALLDRLMAGEPAPAEPVRVPPVGVVERESTDMLAVTDVEVARALRHVARYHRGRMGLKDVVRATGISLRRLQTRFKAALGRTILQEINGRRVRHAQKLLQTTNKKVRAVALESGFGSAVKLIRVFGQYVGTSPKRYRRQWRAEFGQGPLGVDPGGADRPVPQAGVSTAPAAARKAGQK
ncbi:MAG TPA: substrate-binding domain-containing protein [Tepidisphaeraceae bacterium]|nr:substrate-binding domain-containing protein [Tepidisphaeraceae bacterium]